jgi:hypothetical protein
MADRKEMIAALKSALVPKLKLDGFSGSFPHFRRETPESFDLVTFQFDRQGGGFVIEIARCLPIGIDRSPTIYIEATKARAWDRHPNYRKRIQPKKGGGSDSWFRFDREDPVDVAKSALVRLRDPNIWNDVSPTGTEHPYAKK